MELLSRKASLVASSSGNNDGGRGGSGSGSCSGSSASHSPLSCNYLTTRSDRYKTDSRVCRAARLDGSCVCRDLRIHGNLGKFAVENVRQISVNQANLMVFERGPLRSTIITVYSTHYLFYFLFSFVSCKVILFSFILLIVLIASVSLSLPINIDALAEVPMALMTCYVWSRIQLTAELKGYVSKHL